MLLLAALAADLRPGMELIYASAGRDQAPWVVEVLERGLPLKDGADCARLGIRRQPGRTAGAAGAVRLHPIPEDANQLSLGA